MFLTGNKKQNKLLGTIADRKSCFYERKKGNRDLMYLHKPHQVIISQINSHHSHQVISHTRLSSVTLGSYQSHQVISHTKLSPVTLGSYQSHQVVISQINSHQSHHVISQTRLSPVTLGSNQSHQIITCHTWQLLVTPGGHQSHQVVMSHPVVISHTQW